MRKALLSLCLVLAASINLPPMGLAHGALPLAAAADPVACRPSLLPLPRATAEAHVLSRGVTLRVHAVRHPPTSSAAPRRAYISIVEVERRAATVAPVTADVPLLLHPAQPMRQRNTLAVINGDYFEPLRRGDAVPTGALVTNGVPLYVPAGSSNVVAVGADGLLRKTKIFGTGAATTSRGRLPIGAINDPLAGEDVTVAFTSDWARTVPTGRRAIVIKDGLVTKVASADQALRVPADGAVLLVPDSASTDAFARGSAVALDLGVAAVDGKDVEFASGHGGALLVAGRLMPACSAYENSLRPRSMLAWNESGRVWFLAASTRQADPPGGVRLGGATKTQLAEIAQSLGATWAVTMDGGGSTSLYARVDRQARRVDLPSDAWARPVPVLWTVSTRR
jgi:hypothetical protein